MSEEDFYCCGPRSWTRFIGWFTMMMSLISIVINLTMITIVTEMEAEVEWSPGTKTFRYVELGIWLFTFVVSFFMSIVLLRGSYAKNPKYLLAWMVHAAIVLVLFVSLEITNSFLSANIMEMTSVLVFTIVSVFIQVFFIRMVKTYKEKIEASLATVHPLKA